MSALPLSRPPSRLRWRTFPSFQRVQAMNTGGFFGLSGREMLDAERAAERALRAAAYHMGVADQALIGQQRARSASLVLADGGAAEATRGAGVAGTGAPAPARRARRSSTNLHAAQTFLWACQSRRRTGRRRTRRARTLARRRRLAAHARLPQQRRKERGSASRRRRGELAALQLFAFTGVSGQPPSAFSLFAFGCVRELRLSSMPLQQLRPRCGCPDRCIPAERSRAARCALTCVRRCAMLEPRARSVALHLSCFTVMENSVGSQCHVRACS